MQPKFDFTAEERNFYNQLKAKSQQSKQKKPRNHIFSRGFFTEERKVKMIRPPAVYSNPQYHLIYGYNGF